ncbi:MAG: nucleoside transporter NupC [Pirellulaceae bacterium]|nr:MAG: nucleoside transporter NupC [Pirellulaceae bacterium]
MAHLTSRLIAAGGLIVFIALAWLMSSNRRRFPWRIVLGGLGLQFALAALVLLTPQGRRLFETANRAVDHFQTFVLAGSRFILGISPSTADAVDGNTDFFLSPFVFGVLPTVIVFSSLMAVLYHVGIMQLIVKGVALAMQRTLGTSGPETLAAAANIFVGHTEAPLVVRPYLDSLTRSELNALMVGGFATVTGSLLVVYASVGADVGHLVTASVISGPAALLVAKIMEPDPVGHQANRSVDLPQASRAVNIIGAAAQGAADGLRLALNIAAMLIAFLALLAMADFLIGRLGMLVGLVGSEGQPLLTLRTMLAYVFAPLAWCLGIDSNEVLGAARLLGIKMVANEVVAYEELGKWIQDPEHPVSARTRDILTYALCGFSNFGAIGIQVGGIGGLAPKRQAEIAQLGLRAMLGGTLACLMTASIAAIML